MSQNHRQKAASTERCLECEETGSWIYSYEEMLDRLAKESYLALHSHYISTPAALTPYLEHPNVERHNLTVGNQQVEVTIHQPLFDIKILNQINKSRIILWGINPTQAVNLLSLVIASLEETK